VWEFRGVVKAVKDRENAPVEIPLVFGINLLANI